MDGVCMAARRAGWPPREAVRPTPLLSFFFSSRRRHTRSLCDWSSDVCSSDLIVVEHGGGLVPDYDVRLARTLQAEIGRASCRERSVDLGGRGMIKKKKLTAYRKSRGLVSRPEEGQQYQKRTECMTARNGPHTR